MERYIEAIKQAYPQLNIQTCRLNQNGQFNTVLQVNEALIFRFPKTRRELDTQQREVALLRDLQGKLPLPVPDPVYLSRDNAPVGEWFMGYAMLPGEPLYPALLHSLDEQTQQHLAEQLARFLRQLHAYVPKEPAPEQQQFEQWHALYKRFQTKLYPFMRPDAREQVSKHFDAFLSKAHLYSYQPAFIHGDFGPGNILYNPETRSISGIIDFSSADRGDPASDFAALLCSVSYGEAFLARFTSIYPEIETMLIRARFYAGTFALQEALYGLEDGDEQAFKNGIAAYR
uniref:6'-aminoglycoside N-acetyltransferase n=1 Tax=Thermosporothrix sp. COM3 TaxID=2490863 RepID=A0A455SCG4_9CHLR|nr:6'-aminoglycoside N-acetyltransferase [Thermosporothrix sp. COM3]